MTARYQSPSLPSKPWLCRILDAYSPCSSSSASKKEGDGGGYYLLIQHLSYLYVYMLHPNAKELTLVQVNRSQLLP